MNGKNLNLKWVSDEIGNDYKEWKCGDIVTINAQTGTGKTHFIINKLIGYFNLSKDYLYICNRVELKRQIKYDLIQKYNLYKKFSINENTCDKVEIAGVVCDKKLIDDTNKFKNVTIKSYHNIIEDELEYIYNNQKNYLHKYDYIICDECHFFLTDAAFNSKSYIALNKLVNEYYDNSVRIFISATIDEVFESINKAHDKIRDDEVFIDIKKHEYSTGIDYSYINAKYFSKDKDMIQTIRNDKSNDKWLWFVTSKSVGRKIKSELKEYNIDAEFISAESNNREKKNISAKGSFSCKVLITTKCLDNGVNMTDGQLKNIILNAYDKVTFIQELGRKRVNIDMAQMINLYIPTLSSSKFEKLLYNSNNKLEQALLFKENKEDFNRRYNDNVKEIYGDIFRLDKFTGKLTINDIGLTRAVYDTLFYEEIVGKFNSKIYDQFAYIKEQLSWLGLEDTFNESNLIEEVFDEVVKDELKIFLEKAYNNNEKFTKDYFKETVMNIINSDNNIRIKFNEIDGGNKRDKGMIKFNQLFKEKLKYDYRVGSIPVYSTIDGKRNKKTYWIITKEK